jgi:hypothetical protein
MPEKKTIERAWKAKREGKAPTTQGGEFVRELLPTGSQLGDTPQFTATLYFPMAGVQEFFERIKNKVEIVWPLEVMDYGQKEFGVRDWTPPTGGPSW